MGISYTPGKANVMVDVVSRKAYCSKLEVQIHQPRLYEELRQLNLEIVPRGYVNSLIVEVDLDKDIKFIQKADSDVEKMKRYLATENPSDYRFVDDQALYF